MKKFLCNTALVVFTMLTMHLYAQDTCTPLGWATQNGGTSGGGSATPVTVTSMAALKTQAVASGAKVIYVSGTIGAGVSDRIVVASDKTIIGLAGATINGGFHVKNAKNVIIRNLTVKGPGSVDVDGVDCITVDNSTNVWLDHLTIQDGQDGNLDVVNGSNYISITWCKFLYTGASSNHQFSNLFGNSDSKTTDRGKLKITVMNNWWTSGCRERMPRVRFGQVHVVNNLFDSPQASHCVRAGLEANILVESNVFRGVAKPIDLYENNFTAVTQRNNLFIGTSGNASGSGTSFVPPYSLTIAAASGIEVPIKTCAGATLPNPRSCSSCSKLTPVNTPPSVSLTSPANNASFSAPASITIAAAASDADGSVSTVQFFQGTTLLATDATAPFSYSWTGIPAGTYTLTAKATDNEGASTSSSAIMITVGNTPVNTPPTVTITAPANNGSFTTPASITIAATATDANGTVSSVQFYQGTTLLGTDATAPYSITWTGMVAGTYSLTAKASDNAGASTISSPVLVSITVPPVTTSGIISVDCGSKEQVIALQLSADLLTNATGSSWWYTGAAQGISAVAGTLNKATLIAGSGFGAGEVCVGVNYSVAPWWKQYCKQISICNAREAIGWTETINTAALVYPNPSEESFFLPFNEELRTVKVVNALGEEVLIIERSGQNFGKELKAGTYMLQLQYFSGKQEIVKIVKLR